MVTCEECGFSFHEHCSVNGSCSPTSENSDEVSASECPQCSGEFVSELVQGRIEGFMEGYGLGLRLLNQHCLSGGRVEWPNSDMTGPVQVEGLTELSVPLAEYLSGLDDVFLPDLREFDGEAATILSGFSGEVLNLSGLQSLSGTAAKLLSNVKGILNLGGLTDLSNETAKLLVGSQKALSLEGLVDLDEETAEALIQLSPNSTIHLDGLTRISPQTAAILASYNGGIELSGLEALSSELASIFAQHEGELILSPFIELEEEVISILKGKSGSITGPWFFDDEDDHDSSDNEDEPDDEIPTQGHPHQNTPTKADRIYSNEDLLLQLLVEAGLLIPEHVADIRGRLGDVGLIQHLLEHGDITETLIAEVSAGYVGMHVVDLSSGFIDPALGNYLSFTDCHRFNAVPFADDGVFFHVALVDVLDFDAQNAIARIVDRECKFCAAPMRGVQAAWEQIFGNEAEQADASQVSWQGPLSISIGLSSGYYCNTELSKGTADDECLNALQLCEEILAMKDAGGRSLSIGWADLSNDEGGSIRYPSIMSDKKDVAKVINDIRNFMSPQSEK